MSDIIITDYAQLLFLCCLVDKDRLIVLIHSEKHRAQ